MKRRPLDYETRAAGAGGRRWPVGGTVVIALIVAFAQSGASAGMLAYRLMTDGVLAVIWAGAMWGIGWPVFRSVERRMGVSVPLLLRVVTAVGIGFGVTSLAVLGLGLAGWLNTVTAWSWVVLGIGVGGTFGWRGRPSPQPSPTSGGAVGGSEPGGRSRERGPEGASPVVALSPWRFLWVLAMPFLGLAIVGATVPPGLLWQDEPAGYDVAEYHLQAPREWYEAGRVVPLRHNAFSFMPMNAEMHDLLAMHLRGGPWAGMYLAQFIHVATMAVAVLAVAGVAGAMSADRPWAAPLAGVAMAAVPWVTSLAPIAYNEGALMLLGALAFGWAMLARDWRGWAVAGAVAGFACGTKLTAAPMVVGGVIMASAGVAVFTAIRRAPQTGRPNGLIGITVFALLSGLTFAPWLVRNAAWTGNPVFPEAMEVLGRGHFTDVQVTRWRTAHSPVGDERTLGGRLAAGWRRIGTEWQYGYVFLPLAVAALALGRDRRAAWLAGVLAVQSIVWLGFTHLQGRFFVLAIPVGAIAIGLVRVRWWAWAATSAVGVIAGVGFCILNFDAGRFPLVRAIAGGGLLGVEDLRWVVEGRAAVNLEAMPADRPLILVGDAQAFFYSNVPMTRLRYRTVFDVPAAKGGAWVEAWTGGARGPTAFFPGELLRFKRYYFEVASPADDELIGAAPSVSLEGRWTAPSDARGKPRG